MSRMRWHDKTVAATLALFGGVFGAHRFYLRGWRDPIGWLHWPLLLLGLRGALRLLRFGLDDAQARLLLPLLALLFGVAMLQAVLIALTPDARWDARWNRGSARSSASGWGAVIVIAVALLSGAAVLMAGLAYFLLQSFQLS